MTSIIAIYRCSACKYETKNFNEFLNKEDRKLDKCPNCKELMDRWRQ